jgi:hypothetical protein
VVESVERGLAEPVVDAAVRERRRLFREEYLYRPNGDASRRTLDRIAELVAAAR